MVIDSIVIRAYQGWVRGLLWQTLRQGRRDVLKLGQSVR